MTAGTPLAAWQQGTPLARLRDLAAPFKASTKGHVYGAFGLIKERDVAEALRSGRLRAWPPEGAPLMVALVKRLAHGSQATDFRGLPIRLPAQCLVVEDFGYLPEASEEAIAASLIEAAGSAGTRVVEWFREDERLSRVILGDLGARLCATKIAAGSEIKAVALLGGGDPTSICPPVSAEDDLTLGLLLPDVLTGGRLAEIRAEVQAADIWAQHYSSYNKRQSWTAFALRGFNPKDPLDIVKPAEMSRAWKKEHPEALTAQCDWTVAAPRLPATTAFVGELLSGLGISGVERVRLMRLAPGGGELARHADITDRQAGTRDGMIARLHLPIETSPASQFQAWTREGARLQWQMPEGALCYLDQRKPHTVVNAHRTDARVHLVIDVEASASLRDLLRKARPASAALGGEPEARASARKQKVNGEETHPAAEGWRETGLTFASGTPRRDEVSLKLQETSSGTSIFDPVLCELAYRWFCPPAGLVLDPFAGGSVRGIVASKLGRHYVGVDLSGAQIAANEAQAARICESRPPRWILGDSADLPNLCAGIEADFLFSCPPYGDLERYSDDPRDISTMDYPSFLVTYRKIIAAGLALLRPDRFACFVVGDLRDSQGFYRRFVSDTEQAFEEAGARLYNEAILVTAVGSLPIRVGRQFESARKLGKTHQNVLVFCKGDPRKATQACGPVEFGDAQAEEAQA